MNILEAFFFTFQADTRPMREGIDAGRRGANQLNQELNHTEDAAKKISESFLDLAKSAGALVTGVLAFGAIKAMTEASAEATVALAAQARELRTNVDTLNAWQKVAIASGGTAEGLNETFKKLSGMYRDPEKALMRIADRFKGISDLHADRLGEMFGIDKGTVQSMRDGAAGLQLLLDHQKALSSVTKEDVDAAKAFKRQLTDTNTVYDDVRRKIATEILPYMTKFLKAMEVITIWARDNKYFVLSFFGAIATIIAGMYIPAMIRAVVATYALLAPYLLVGAAVAAVAAVFALAFDDVMNFLDGNKSVIGDLAKRWPIIGEIVMYFVENIRLLGAVCKAVFGFITDTIMSGPRVALENLNAAFDKILEGVLTRFPALAPVFEIIGEVMRGIATGIGNAWTDLTSIIMGVVKLAVWAAEKLAGGYKAVKGFFGGAPGQVPTVKPYGQVVSDEAVAQAQVQDGKPGAVGTPAASVQQVVLIGQQQLAQTNNPINSLTSNSITNSAKSSNVQRTVKIDKIEIQTQATDAKGISEGVQKSLTDALISAHDSFDDGVHA